MKKNFIKMNSTETDLSLGNFCRLVKEIAQNKGFANQTEIFYALFDVSDISDSTVNNYCIGYRAIGTEFKQKYIKLKKEYEKDLSVFDDILISLMSILDGEVYKKINHQELLLKIENHPLFNKLSLNLYNLAKNDKTVNDEFTKNIHNEISKKQIYKALCDILIYITLEKKQPIYEENSKKELIENILNNTNISTQELEKFLKLQLQEGINYTYSLKTLAKENNPYACFEMGDMEYNGKMTGYPRYVKAYEYFKKAALKNHPRASWLIAQMFYQKKIGTLSKEDLELAFTYLKKAEKEGSIAAINTIGICYLKGLVPNEKKDINKAIKYFEKACTYNYVYAYNNLGKIYENKKEYEKAFKYFIFSADKEESWACNKIGQYYRLGIGITKDMKKAYEYYKVASSVPLNLLDPWSFYNLAKYFYLNGNSEAVIEKDVDKAIDYFKKSKLPEAYEELIYIYIEKYDENKEYYFNKINECLNKLSKDKYYDKCEEKLKNKLLVLKKKHLALVKSID